jgi:hypothetical protein
MLIQIQMLSSSMRDHSLFVINGGKPYCIVIVVDAFYIMTSTNDI